MHRRRSGRRHRLPRRGQRRGVQVGQLGRQLDAGLRPGLQHLLDRGDHPGPERHQHRPRGHRRGQRLGGFLRRRRAVPLARRRRALGAARALRHGPHRAHRDRPRRLRTHLRGGDGPAVLHRSRPRALPQRGRGRELQPGAVRQRQHRRVRRCDQPGASRDRLLRHLGARAPPDLSARVRPGLRHLAQRGSRNHVDPAHDRAARALGRGGAHRARARALAALHDLCADHPGGGRRLQRTRALPQHRRRQHLDAARPRWRIVPEQLRRPQRLRLVLRRGEGESRQSQRALLARPGPAEVVRRRRNLLERHRHSARGRARAVDRSFQHESPLPRQRRRILQIDRRRRDLDEVGRPSDFAVLRRRGGCAEPSAAPGRNTGQRHARNDRLPHRLDGARDRRRRVQLHGGSHELVGRVRRVAVLLRGKRAAALHQRRIDVLDAQRVRGLGPLQLEHADRDESAEPQPAAGGKPARLPQHGQRRELLDHQRRSQHQSGLLAGLRDDHRARRLARRHQPLLRGHRRREGVAHRQPRWSVDRHLGRAPGALGDSRDRRRGGPAHRLRHALRLRQ